MADNYQYRLLHDQPEALARLLTTVLHTSSAVGYSVDGNRLLLYWAQHDKMVPFAVPYSNDNVQALAELVLRWLNSVQYGPPPDHDGDNRRGYLAYNEDWGHVDGKWQACLAVEPIWCMYGK